LLVVVLIAAALTLLVQLRKHAPPESARLLPGGDGFFYINLQWIRRAGFTSQLPPVVHDPDYEMFLQATGFQFERDLDEAAFAIHYPESMPKGTPRQDQSRFSEVFVGRIQGDKLSAYLKKIASSVDNYRSIDIYNIPLEGRTFRVAVLGVDTVGASNHPDPMVIRGMIDRSRKLASPFGGPSFLRQFYKEVPLASLSWAILRVDPANAAASSPINLSFLFNHPAVVVASLRYLGKVHLRAEAFAGSDDEAARVSQQLGTFLDWFRAGENSSAQMPDPDVKQLLDSLQIGQRGDRAILQATVPPGFLKKALQQPSTEWTPGSTPGAPPEAAPDKTTRP
jgi:hypothetical protein